MQPVHYFKALADETRLRLLNLLRKKELNVNEIVSVLAMGQSRISRHLKILNESGLLESRRDGLWVFYRAASGREGSKLIECLADFLDREENRESDFARLEEMMREGAARKKEYFDAIAPDWEDIRADILGDFDAARVILPYIRKEDRVADLGCGTGEVLLQLQTRGHDCIGVDRSPRMLEMARQRLENIDADLRIGEIEHLPLREGETDAAVINMVLHHLVEPAAAFEEAARVIRSGGRLIVIDLARHDREELRSRYGHRWLGFDENEMKGLFETAGFTISEYEEFPVGQDLNVVLYHGERR